MKKMIKQIVGFIGISGIGWLLDFFTYSILSYTIGDLFISNIIGAFIGVTFVFTLASNKIFKDNGKVSLRKKYIAYIIYQCILVYMISILLVKVNNSILIPIMIRCDLVFASNVLAKILITPITMLCNFLFMKVLIEKYK